MAKTKKKIEQVVEEKKPNPVGRPRKEVDEKLLEALTKLHLSDKVISEVLGISVWTLERNYAQEMESWRSMSKSKIAEVLFDEGITKREPWALKALAQKHLDYVDKVKSEVNNTHTFENLDDESLEKEIEATQKRLKGSGEE